MPPRLHGRPRYGPEMADPFAAPQSSPAAGPPTPSALRVGALLALVGEIVWPLIREAVVWKGLATLEGTTWTGMVSIVLQVSAAMLLATSSPRSVRPAIGVVGVFVLIVVPSSWMGWTPERLVDPLTRLALAAIEVSQAVAAAIALRSLDRRHFSRIAWVSVVAASASALVGTGLAGSSKALALLVAGAWLGSRLLRYVVLLRLLAPR